MGLNVKYFSTLFTNCRCSICKNYSAANVTQNIRAVKQFLPNDYWFSWISKLFCPFFIMFPPIQKMLEMQKSRIYLLVMASVKLEMLIFLCLDISDSCKHL